MTGSVIQANGLLKRYSYSTALRKGSFSVPSGTVTGFVGKNGAGKTTTLRIVATLLDQDSGDCEVLGFDTRRDAREVRRRIGFVPDEPRVPGLLTLQEYLSTLAGMYGLTSGETAKRVASITALTGTSSWVDRRMHGLSRGELQRVAIARSLVNDPEVVIMDEPTSGLDPQARVEFKELLALLRDRGKTVFISSHLLFDIEEVSDHIILIDQGEITFEGDVHTLKKSLGKATRWRLGFASKLPEQLALPPQCRIVTNHERWIEVEGDLDDEERAQWMAALMGRGHKICELSPSTPSLEALFARSLEIKGEEL